MKQPQYCRINLGTVSLRIIKLKEIASNTCLHDYLTTTIYIYIYIFRHLVTSSAHLKDFVSYKHSLTTCLSICAPMQFIVVYGIIGYTGWMVPLWTTGIHREGPRQDPGPSHTGFYIWFTIYWEYYQYTKCGPELGSIFFFAQFIINMFLNVL